ncbi:MAG: Ig-like domain-containing protein [Gemmatimonadota bacterium]
MTANPTCTRCGETITPGARFCQRCGSDVSGEQGAVATAMMPATEDADAAMLAVLRSATLGDYEILSELGRGGMATVYLAHDIALDRKVAIKVMSPALLLMGEGMVERFKREARTSASLSHPNIIPIHAVKSQGRALYFVMKFIAGRSLESIIREVGALPIPMAQALLHQVGGALGYAHRRGVVHRDIKPANIMVDDEGWAVVTDFGIAKVAEARGLTMTGIAVGTPSYMSPEQCAAKDITGKSDQYSLGVVAYEMVTGKQPFDADSAMAIMFAHFHEQPKPIQDLRPDCPPALATAIMRMLEKSPDQRWPSVEDAVAAMGGHSLAHDDPVRGALVELVRSSPNQRALEALPPPPTSPIPPMKTQVEAATTPIPVPRIVSIGVTPPSANLAVGETARLNAAPQASGGTAAHRPLSWSSSDASVATVNGEGLVTAVSPGKATISVGAEGITGRATVTVTPAAVASVVIAPPTLTLVPGTTGRASVTLSDAAGRPLSGREIVWSGGVPAIATVGRDGTVRAIAPGNVTLTATSEGRSGTVVVTVTPVPVARLTIKPLRTLTVGDHARMSAEVQDKAGKALSGREIAWNSADASILELAADGEAKALKPGRVAVTASSEGQSALITVTVVAAPVAPVAPAAPAAPSTPIPLAEVPTIKMEASALASLRSAPTDPIPEVIAKPVAVPVRSENAESPPVQPADTRPAERASRPIALYAGIILAIVVGAFLFLRGRKSPVPVGPGPAAIGTIAIKAPTGPLSPGSTAQLTAVAKDRDGNELPVPRPAWWTSSDTAVARVSLTGVVSAIHPGSATVTATIDSQSATASLVVAANAPPPPAAVAEIALNGPSAPLQVGGTAQLSAAVKDAHGAPLTGRTLVWSSSDPAVATVSSTGLLTALAAGSTTLDASSEDRHSTLTIRVSPAPQPVSPPPTPVTPAVVAAASISISPAAESLVVGSTAQLSANPLDARGAQLKGRTTTWASSDPRIASVSDAGLVTALAPGVVSISATADTRHASSKIVVAAPRPTTIPVAAVAVSKPPRNLAPGETLQLTAAVRDAKGNALENRGIAWTSSNTTVATVSSSGLVTAIGAGTTTVAATSETEIGSTTVTVNRAAPPPVAAVASIVILPPGKPLKPGETVQLSATVKDARGAVLTDRPLTWSSSAQSIAKVSAGGIVTALAAGSAEIGASAEGKGATATISVVAPAAVAPPVNSTASSTAAGTARKAVAVGATWTCSLLPNGAVSCWGGGQNSPQTLGGGIALTSLSTGAAYACGLSAGGKAYCWGENAAGQLGDGTAQRQPTPALVVGDLAYSTISAGSYHTCALTTGGKAYCWGKNESGQLGNGEKGPQKKPVAVAGGLTFTTITAGGGHSCGLTSAGAAWCWGDGWSGSLGYGPLGAELAPVQVSGDLKFTRISAGVRHTCALTGAGKAYCWGDNSSGQIGDGSTNDRATPVAVAGAVSFESISAGVSHTCAVGSDGHAYCWGENKAGQLGDGTHKSRSKPAPVSGATAFASVSAGGTSSCGTTRTGEALCWGGNARGQLGDGTTTNHESPEPIGASAQ